MYPLFMRGRLGGHKKHSKRVHTRGMMFPLLMQQTRTCVLVLSLIRTDELIEHVFFDSYYTRAQGSGFACAGASLGAQNCAGKTCGGKNLTNWRQSVSLNGPGRTATEAAAAPAAQEHTHVTSDANPGTHRAGSGSRRGSRSRHASRTRKQFARARE
jgi:hypothetical protein